MKSSILKKSIADLLKNELIAQKVFESIPKNMFENEFELVEII